jgi:hypothetical protein
MDSPSLTYTPRPDATPESELNVIANVYRYVLFNSQSTRGGPRDLTNKTTTEHVENGPRTTEKEIASRG